MEGSINIDSDGVETSARPPNKKGFVQVDTSGTEYELSDTPPIGAYMKVQRIHAVCTDPTGSVGGVWELRDNPDPGGNIIISLPQPILAAALTVGKEIIFEFPTAFSALQNEKLIIKPTSNLGKWKIAAFGYYTKVQER